MTSVASAFRRKVVVLALVVCASAAHAEVIDRILAVVSGQTVTLSDVMAARQLGLVDPPPGTADPVVYIIDHLIDRTLMLAEVDRFQPPEPDPVEVESDAALPSPSITETCVVPPTGATPLI